MKGGGRVEDKKIRRKAAILAPECNEQNKWRAITIIAERGNKKS